MEPVPVQILPATEPGSICVVNRAAQPGLANQHHRQPGSEQGVVAGSWSRWATGASGCSGPAREDPSIDQPVPPASGGGADPLNRRGDEAPVQGLAGVRWPGNPLIAWKQEWRAHRSENYPGLQGDTLRQVLVDHCLRRADWERVHYRSTVAQVWEYLDRAYQRQDVFLHDLMKPVLAHI
jgi:hypothetical protein